MRKNFKLYRTLFTSTFSLSAFTFGGGYVIVPLMKKRFVERLKWIEEEEMLNLIAISQSTPGAMAVNASILVGYKVAGVTGAIIALLGTVLPPLVIITVISMFYGYFKENKIINAVLKGMEAGVAAVIMDVVISMGTTVIKGKKIISILMMIGAFIAAFFFNVNVILIIVLGGFIGALVVLYREKKGNGVIKS